MNAWMEIAGRGLILIGLCALCAGAFAVVLVLTLRALERVLPREPLDLDEEDARHRPH